MRLKITPLGGAKQSQDKVAAAIVNYLVTPPGQLGQTGGWENRGGAETYYADQGEEPGRWFGQDTDRLGLSGEVKGAELAMVLQGRHPTTGERLITAQGSAGRRTDLGVGSMTMIDPDGEPVYDERDAAAAIGIEPGEVAHLLDNGTAQAGSRLFAWFSGTGKDSGTGFGTASGSRPASEADAQPGRLSASYLVPVIDEDGGRWIRDSELTRLEEQLAASDASETIADAGAPDDLLPLAQAAELVGVTPQYLRSLARRYETDRELIDEIVTAGRQPRSAYLVAHRASGNAWLVRRSDLIDFVRRRRQANVVVGYDVTATTEKSISLLALLSDYSTGREVFDAVEAANDHALGWLEIHAARTRLRGRSVPVEGWTVASFRHLTSRALDPFVHHHNVIANTVVGPDGRRRAIDARRMYDLGRAASALATAEMRRRITTQLGVRWRPGAKASWEIDGISDTAVTAFSTRRNEIEDAVRELEEEIGRGASADEVDRVSLATRRPKQPARIDELRTRWWEQAEAVGLDADDLAACLDRIAPGGAPDPEEIYAQLAGPDGICQSLSIFTYGDLLAALVDLPVPQPDGGDPQPLILAADELEELAHGFLRSAHVTEIKPHADLHQRQFTVTEMHQAQERIMGRYTDGLRDQAAVVPPDTLDEALVRNSHLTEEQQALVRTFCTSGQRIQCAIGRAGAGKTTAMRTAAEAWQAAGYKVVGAAVKGEAARILGDNTGITTETLAWWLAHDYPHTAPLDARTVLIVDEASTIADRDLDQFGWLAEQTGATLRLIGDPAQHSSVGAGGMFRVLCEQHPDHTPELTRNLRLRNPHDQAAADALRDGSIDRALDHLDAAGQLHIIDDEADYYRHVLARWWQAQLAGQPHPMVDRRNSVRRRLNQLAHRILQAHGEIGTDELPRTSGCGFSIGDRVIARAPNRDLHADGDRNAYVRNGATGTVTALHPDGSDPANDALIVDVDDIGTVRVPRSFFDEHETGPGQRDVGLDHAYAVTSYAVQGSTRTTSTSRIDARSTRSETYVDITRGTDSNHLFVTRHDDALDDEELPRIPEPSPDRAVADRLRNAKGERTAWEILNASRSRSSDRDDSVGI